MKLPQGGYSRRHTVLDAGATPSARWSGSLRMAYQDERDLPILAMLVNHVPPTEIADALQISQGWLEARRWAVLQRIVGAMNAPYPRGLADEPSGSL